MKTGQTDHFGAFAKCKRMSLGLSLREFCRTNGFDWAHYSRIERGGAAPPRSREAREIYARALGLEEGSEDWQTFFDLADISAGRIPEDIMGDEALLESLPVLFRTLEGKKLTKEQLESLAEDIRKA